jgi:hypothetical protein
MIAFHGVRIPDVKPWQRGKVLEDDDEYGNDSWRSSP